MRNGTRSAIALVLAVGLALALAACGSSGKSNSSSTSSSSGASSSANSLSGKKPIVIGTIADYTGYNASNVGDVPQVVKAWEDMVNAGGGINGYPVKVDLEDSQSSPTLALQDAKQLIAQDHVMAIAGSYTNEDVNVAPYVTKSGVPWIGGASYEPPATSDADWFPTGADVGAYEWGIGHAAAKQNEKKWGLLYCSGAAICGELGSIYGPLVKSVFGATLAYSGQFSTTAPSYTSQCIALKQSGANAVYIVGPASLIYTNCAQQGVTATEYLTGGIAPQIISNPAAAGAIDTVPDVPIVDTTTPGAKVFHAAIEKYAPSIVGNPEYTDALMPVWAGLQMFRYVGDASKLTPNSTPTQVKAGLWKVKDQTLGGLAPSLTYVKNQPTHVNCVFFEQVKDKKLVEPYGSAPQCIPASQLTAVDKIFG